MTQRLAREKRQRAEGNLNSDEGPVAKVLVSLVLRSQVFLEMTPEDQMEYLERRIGHRISLAAALKEDQESWRRLCMGPAATDKAMVLNIAGVIKYTKFLVRNVKQLMRQIWVQAKQDFPDHPEEYINLIPYPADAYDPMVNPFEVDQTLFDLVPLEGNNSVNKIWTLLQQARTGALDNRLIAVYGITGTAWPDLKGDGSDALESHPVQVRLLIQKLQQELVRRKARVEQEKVKAAEAAELARLDAIRVKVTFHAKLGSADTEESNIFVVQSWNNFPVPTSGNAIRLQKDTDDLWKASVGVGLGSHSCYFGNGKDKILAHESKKIVLRFHLVEADQTDGKIIDLSTYLVPAEGLKPAPPAAASGVDAVDAVLPAEADGAEETDSADSDGGREKDDEFKPMEANKKGAPVLASRITRTHGHEIDCTDEHPINPHITQQELKTLSYNDRILLFNDDARKLLQEGGSQTMWQGRDGQPSVTHLQFMTIKPDCLFGDIPFGWFNLPHDVRWSKDYLGGLCVAAFQVLSDEGVFVIRYGGWFIQDIYEALKDAGFTIRQKQPRVHVQDPNQVSRKCFATCGHEANVHVVIIVGYKSRESKKQYVDNTSWMLKSTPGMKNNASVILGIPGVPFNQKVTVGRAVVRVQQMSLPESVEIVHRFCPPNGVFMDICCGTGRTALACILLARQCIMNDRDPLAIDVTARDALRFMRYLHEETKLAQLGTKPLWDGVDPFTGFFAMCDGKPVRKNEYGVPVGPVGNTPLGWPKEGVEDLNKYLGTSGFKIVGGKLVVEKNVDDETIPGGVHGGYRRRGRNNTARTPYVMLTCGELLIRMHPNGPAAYVQIIGQDDKGVEPPPVPNCVFEEQLDRDYDDPDRVVVRVTNVAGAIETPIVLWADGAFGEGTKCIKAGVASRLTGSQNPPRTTSKKPDTLQKNAAQKRAVKHEEEEEEEENEYFPIDIDGEDEGEDDGKKKEKGKEKGKEKDKEKGNEKRKKGKDKDKDKHKDKDKDKHKDRDKKKRKMEKEEDERVENKGKPKKKGGGEEEKRTATTVSRAPRKMIVDKEEEKLKTTPRMSVADIQPGPGRRLRKPAVKPSPPAPMLGKRAQPLPSNSREAMFAANQLRSEDEEEEEEEEEDEGEEAYVPSENERDTTDSDD